MGLKFSQIAKLQADSIEMGNLRKKKAQRLLTFRLNNEVYGVDIMKVREIKGWAEIYLLPNLVPFMSGAINMNGKIIPIFDLSARLDLGITKVTPRHLSVILSAQGHNIGILTDNVPCIISLETGNATPLPDTHTNENHQFISGRMLIDSRIVTLLNPDLLFDLQHIKKATQLATQNLKTFRGS